MINPILPCRGWWRSLLVHLSGYGTIVSAARLSLISGAKSLAQFAPEISDRQTHDQRVTTEQAMIR